MPATSTTDTPANPFRGLRPFDAEETHLFFGREDEIDELLRRLGRSRLLAIVGTSGSGKSSLARAGLLPALCGGFLIKAGSSWRMVIIRPGEDPIGNLARELTACDLIRSNQADAKTRSAIIEAVLRRSALGLIEAARQARLDDRESHTDDHSHSLSSSALGISTDGTEKPFLSTWTDGCLAQDRFTRPGIALRGRNSRRFS